MLFEVTLCELGDELSGSGLLLYSRNISQGAYVSGEIKRITLEVAGKPIHPQAYYYSLLWLYRCAGVTHL